LLLASLLLQAYLHADVGITEVTASNAVAGVAAFDGVPAVENI
jgi:hypothetical protein